MINKIILAVLFLISAVAVAKNKPSLGANAQNSIHKIVRLQSHDLLKSNPAVFLQQAENITDFGVLPKDSKQIRIDIGGGDIVHTVYLRFQAEDSANVMLSILKDNTPYIFIYDAESSPQSEIGSWTDIWATNMYVLNPETNKLTKVGDIVGPKRSVEQQGLFERLLIWYFGKERMNNVNLEIQNRNFNNLTI